MIEEFEPRKDDVVKKAWESFGRMLDKQALIEMNRMLELLNKSVFEDKKHDWDLELKTLPRR